MFSRMHSPIAWVHVRLSVCARHAQDGAEGMPELWLPICLSNAVVEGDLASSSATLPASHAGIWGLAKASSRQGPGRIR